MYLMVRVHPTTIIWKMQASRRNLLAIPLLLLSLALESALCSLLTPWGAEIVLLITRATTEATFVVAHEGGLDFSLHIVICIIVTGHDTTSSYALFIILNGLKMVLNVIC